MVSIMASELKKKLDFYQKLQIRELNFFFLIYILEVLMISWVVLKVVG